jgi:uncharacterized protein (UPF0276 family)
MDLPYLGVGLGLRQELRSFIDKNKERIDFVEPMTENTFALTERVSDLPLVLHGTKMSLGNQLDIAYLQKVKDAIRIQNPVWFSDHVAYSSAEGIDVGLMPIVFDEDSVALFVKNIRMVKNNIPIPFLIENIASHFKWPNSTMNEEEFIRRILSESDSYLLLDLHNVWANSVNFGFDPYEFVNKMPLERVIELHLAGGLVRNGVIIDTHGEAVPRDVWDLMSYVVHRSKVRAALLERDQNFPSTEQMLKELDTARRILEEV